MHAADGQGTALRAISVIYMCWGGVLVVGVILDNRSLNDLRRYAIWLDLCWFASILFLTSGAEPALIAGLFVAALILLEHQSFKNFLLPALVVSMFIIADRWFDLGSIGMSSGFKSEWLLTISFVCFLLVIVIHSLLRESYESTFRRRLMLLAETGDLANPRFGVERTLLTLLEKLRDFYGADEGLLLDREEGGQRYSIRRTTRSPDITVTLPDAIGEGISRQLIEIPETQAFVISHSEKTLSRDYHFEFDASNGYRRVRGTELASLEFLTEMFDGRSILSVPLLANNKVRGRLLLVSKRSGIFSESDPKFLSQLVDKALPIIDNLRLIDTLASSARERERQRIARDIHDSVVQPYVGIQLGLTGVRQKLKAGEDVADDIERLLEMADLDIYGLRSYIAELSSEIKYHRQLMPAARQLAERFTATTGIVVEVRSWNELDINDRLAGEVFQMIAEGLSNIRRHTKASRARISIECAAGALTLNIADNGSREEPDTLDFVPKSLNARARSLGGDAQIQRALDGGTIVSISVPL